MEEDTRTEFMLMGINVNIVFLSCQERGINDLRFPV